MISHKHNFIFIHIPKTGGTSVEEVLFEKEEFTERNLWMGMTNFRNRYQTDGLQHLASKHVLTEVGKETFFYYFKFTFVRNPWDKAISQWLYTRTRPALLDWLDFKGSRSLEFKKYLELIQEREIRSGILSVIYFMTMME